MGRTPQRVIDLLHSVIPSKISKNRFCIQTGINQNSIDKYMSGIAEPTQASLEKIAKYFEVPAAWLRGENQLDDLDFYSDIAHTVWPEERIEEVEKKYRVVIDVIDAMPEFNLRDLSFLLSWRKKHKLGTRTF